MPDNRPSASNMDAETRAYFETLPKLVQETIMQIGVEISVIACVLTEGQERTEYQGIPLVCLDHIPLPGKE